MAGKIVIVTSPSGAGKTTIVKRLLSKYPQLSFSVSATTRSKRPNEVHGEDYYFLTESDFVAKRDAGEMIEWEEVYAGFYYGTLKSEVERLWQNDKVALFDIDVKGAQNVKAQFGDQVLVIFIKPPSKVVLLERLNNRKTESPESIEKRITRAEFEMQFEDKFDSVVVNDVLEDAVAEVEALLQNFLA